MAAESHNDSICFLVGRPRSGTTVFRNMLETHPAIVSMGEVFNESNGRSYFHFLQRRVADDPGALFPSRSVDNFKDYVAHCRQRALEKHPTNRFVVLDVKYDQSHLISESWWGITFLPRIFSLIRQQRWRVIDIHRHDMLGMFVSNQVAIETRVYHSTDLPKGETRPAKVRIDPAALKRHLTTTAKAYRRVADNFRGYDRYLQVAYEEMFEADSGRFQGALRDRVAGFFGVDNAFNPTPKLSRLLTEDSLSYVENADEIRNVLRETAG